MNDGELGFFRAPAAPLAEAIARAEEPIRAEIFSAERLEQHAASLARAQAIAGGPRFDVDLAARLRSNVGVLRAACRAIAAAASAERAVAPAGEWLLDNFHVIEDQIAAVEEQLPQASARRLPRLTQGFLEGYPRLYGIAWAFIAHTDSRLDPELLIRFLNVYQAVDPLEMRELWALPGMLRIVLIENLRRIAAGVVRAQRGRELADRAVDRIEAAGAGGRADAVQLPAEPLLPSFILQLIERMRYRQPDATPRFEFLAGWLAERRIDLDELVRREHAAQGAANLTAANIVTSMRMIAAYDWSGLFERVSLVEGALRETALYPLMDDRTHDRYRHAIEELAARSAHSELAVAALAVSAAKAPDAARGEAAGDGDPGYFLIGPGRPDLERRVGYRPSAVQRVSRLLVRHATVVYLGGMLALTAALLAAVATSAFAAGVPLAAALACVLLGVFPASDIALALINRVVTAIFRARHLPRLRLREGVPAHLRSFVVVPTLLSDPQEVREQVRDLEVHYLSNPEGDVRFAILSDWRDADRETEPGDEALVRLAAAEIAALNARHPLPASAPGKRFYLFHRRRRWNAAEGKWMGWERKRGKLHEFNRLLRGARDTTYMPVPGEPSLDYPPADVRFVITLDADTRLPIDSVRQLVGTAAHPLNVPRFDPGERRLVEGYAILQPRISPTLPRRDERSLFRRIFSSAGGVSPYAGAVSDVYQDLFGAGNYTGKGLYHVDAFERALAGRIPENAVLSHDLFESLFARCALLSDVEFFEDFPSHAEVAAVRTHRWVRGDWQLAGWALGQKGRELEPIARWKLIDNLRRSLSAPAALALLVLGWSVPGIEVSAWLGLIVVAFAMPGLVSAADVLLVGQRERSARTQLREAVLALNSTVAQVAAELLFLAHNAWLMGDAIVRTLVRTILTRRHLLEWVTAAQAKSQASLALGSFNWFLRGGTILVIAACAAVLYFNPGAFPGAAGLIVLWWSAPAVARLMSLPPKPERARQVPGRAERLYLRLIARRTWRYFAQFVGREDSHLPPDNVQEDPALVVAHRTSPTNIGLYLLSVLAARDFGWLGLAEMATRLEQTFATLARLERHHGHFWNWYDTRTLRPLEPRYLSTVDSGNLVAYLLVLARACDEACESPIFDRRVPEGLADTLHALNERLAQIPANRRRLTATAHELRQAIDAAERVLAQAADGAHECRTLLSTLQPQVEHLIELATVLGAERVDPAGEVMSWARLLGADIASHLRDAECATPEGLPDARLARRLRALAEAARRYCGETRFEPLFDRERRLFSIGARLTEGRLVLDTSYYDLLASEARVASFVAIAKRDVPQSHWFRLGRRLTLVGGRPVLMSWSGSMFEYLMPSLVLYTPRGSLLDLSCRGAIAYQIAYAARRGVPWGISESAFNARDRELTYQYSAFGVEGLGFKRGLAQQLVIAPYATALAAQYDVPAALGNYRRLERLGAQGPLGYYEAIDFTPRRRPEGRDFVLVRTYMAHHQGMTLVALDNVVHAGIMRHRFHREPMVMAAELLLEEHTAHASAAVIPAASQAPVEIARREPPRDPVRIVSSPHTAAPMTHLLSNGRYAAMLTAAGGGYSVCNRIAVTRWREDPTRDDWGSFIYLRDCESGAVWSAGYQPTLAEAQRYEVRFAEDRVRIARRDGALIAVTEVIVSPEDPAELRRLTLTNRGARPREIEITSYCEIALAPAAEDAAHPAFSKLFVETEYFAPARALIARRRPRAREDPELWAAHVVAREHGWPAELEYETDRRAFLGRNRTAQSPLAVMDGQPLTNTTGAVLDPVFSLRTRVKLPPGASTAVIFATMTAGTREAIEVLADKYHDPAAFERASTLAWTHAQVQLHHLAIAAEEARTFQHLAGRIVYSDAALRPGSDFLAANRTGPSGLWTWGISGDRPIVLLRVTSADDCDAVDQLLRAHEFWRSKRLACDLVILNEKKVSYLEDVQVEVESMVSAYASKLHATSESLGSVYALRADRMSARERALIACAARVVLVAGRGSLAEQVMTRERIGARLRAAPHADRTAGAGSIEAPPLEYFNGFGGFAAQGREYAIVLAPGKHTPAPWVNVIANPGFGFLVSESGGSYTWSGNSRQNQLTPWSNDPLCDNSGEALYLRDDESGELWSPTAWPVRIATAAYLCCHGHGYSRFEHRSHGIHSTLLQFVAVNDPVRVMRLRLRNESGRRRRLSVFQYLEWTLGAGRAANAHYVVTDGPQSDRHGTLARNPWNEEFAGAVAFAAVRDGADDWTCDRREFIGRNGSLRAPAAILGGSELGKRAGAGLDPCSVLQKRVELGPQESAEVVFFLGQAHGADAAATLHERLSATDVDDLFAQVTGHWRDALGKVQVKTPERRMDLMLNGWLLYQALGCRLWARSAFYQAGGAYGFRDQLQDGMALALAVPHVVREHLVRAAGRQFVQGDVQHWWHPPAGRGVRTHCSDDRLWLAYAVEHYVRVTGDRSVLDVEIPFLEGPPLDPAAEAAYDLPAQSATAASLYAHCAAALDASLAVGAHGLPLIGGGDWNDGMNRVGHQGRGESVWLGWFLYANLAQFAPLARERGDSARAERWLEHAERLRNALETHGWDGAWYRRAYFDDGTPLGSAANDECRIDAIAQSWALISGAGEPARARRAMESVESCLLRRGDELALLFAPPFDHSALDPGYVKAYLPGVRENGGQYTHAAVWTLIAYALLGDGDTAFDLFSMLNPVNRGSTRTGIHAYRVEPYVVAADVYSCQPHARLGGWTWYTGAAGWLYRAGLEWILGLRVHAGRLLFRPCIPREWREYTVRYRPGRGTWTIRIENPDGAATGVRRVILDGVEQPADAALVPGDIDSDHDIRIVLGVEHEAHGVAEQAAD